jgi:lactobin A/cerein 7B family class IIb bacteriocin
VISFTSRSSAPGDEPHAEKDFGSNEEQRIPTNHSELTLEQLDTVTGGLVNAAVGGAIAAGCEGSRRRGAADPTARLE